MKFHTAPGGRCLPINRANSHAGEAIAPAWAFYSAWGPIGDAMRAAVCEIARVGGFVFPQTTPGAAGATGSTPGATHSSTSWIPSGTACLRLIQAPPAIPNVPGAMNCAASGPPTA
jgi:hypothetical protein